MDFDLKKINQELQGKSPKEIVEWGIAYSQNPVITTNFRPFEAAILYATASIKADIPVIWCDTGYNTAATYRHAIDLIQQLDLNVKLYVPQQTSAHRDVILGIPHIDDPLHQEFTNQVKLEPFKRAMTEHKPDVWFTNLRKGQTTFRDSIDMVSCSVDGILKISPFYNWTDKELEMYLLEHSLPNEFEYFDPTTVIENRECGLHA